MYLSLTLTRYTQYCNTLPTAMWRSYTSHFPTCFTHGPVRYPDSKVHGANTQPIWGRQDPGWLHVAIWRVHNTYTWRAQQIIFLRLYIRGWCAHGHRYGVILVWKIRWLLPASSVWSRHLVSNARYAVLWDILFLSMKISYYENAYVELL